jgi:glycosyltransferase involved in cell wall biosynthesis
MKIAILGTRGIPNNHGGFEQFAEYLSKYLAEKGHQVFVYNSHSHPYQKKLWNGVNIIHCKDPEDRIGTVGQFIYDLNCIIDSRKRNFNLILQLGYTSSSIWGWLLPKKAVIVTNMDGLEWKRSKYSKPVRSFLKIAENLAIKTSDYLVADSIGIQKYLKDKYKKQSEYIAYGAELFQNPNENVLREYKVKSQEYNLLIARLEPENNIEVVLDGVAQDKEKQTFLVIGKHKTKFGEFLKEKFKKDTHIRFLGGIYNIEHLNNLRYYSNIYFHGHSVGGTNPSLLEAMASNCFIVANDNIFNKGVLGDDALYFNNSKDVLHYLKKQKKDYIFFVEENLKKIQQELNWEFINDKYEKYLQMCFSTK